jgi:hypothetical protein
LSQLRLSLLHRLFEVSGKLGHGRGREVGCECLLEAIALGHYGKMLRQALGQFDSDELSPTRATPDEYVRSTKRFAHEKRTRL